jgi:hypothetical protein
MDISEMVVGIIGVVISILFGIWGVYFALRKAKYPASLTYVFEQSISLVDDFAQKLPNLDVTYKQSPLNKSVALLSGYLVNDGSIDITSDMTEIPLQLNLPGECELLEIDVTTKAKSLNVTSTLKDKKNAEFDLGLFRRGESFSFQALVLLDEEHSSLNKNEQLDDIKWVHRIANLGEINNTHLYSHEGKSKKKIWTRRVFGTVVGTIYILMAILMFFSMGPMAPEPAIHFTVELEGKEIEHKFKPLKDGGIKITNVETELSETANLEEYLSKNKVHPIISNTKPPFLTSFFLYCMFIFGGIFMIYISLEKDIKIYRSKKLIAASKREALQGNGSEF